jgi:hypothetical protein
MDPNATLIEIRQLTKALLEGDSRDIVRDGERLAELFDGLDGWLTRAGFLPTDWNALQ